MPSRENQEAGASEGGKNRTLASHFISGCVCAKIPCGGVWGNQMKLRVVAALAALSLAGCQGTPIGDAVIGPEKLAQMDDQYCQSIGAKPGSSVYVQCRMGRTSQRDASHQQAFQRAGAGLSAAGASMQGGYARNVSCTSTPTSTWVGGPVRQVNTTCN